MPATIPFVKVDVITGHVTSCSSEARSRGGLRGSRSRGFPVAVNRTRRERRSISRSARWPRHPDLGLVRVDAASEPRLSERPRQLLGDRQVVGAQVPAPPLACPLPACAWTPMPTNPCRCRDGRPVHLTSRRASGTAPPAVPSRPREVPPRTTAWGASTCVRQGRHPLDRPRLTRTDSILVEEEAPRHR